MSEAEEDLILARLVMPIRKGIRTHNETLVKYSLNQVTDDDLPKVYGCIVTELSHVIDIPNLEPSVQRTVKRDRLRFQELYSELQTFRFKWKQLEKLPEGYGKYQSMTALLGYDPKSWHDWTDHQTYLQLVNR